MFAFDSCLYGNQTADQSVFDVMFYLVYVGYTVVFPCFTGNLIKFLVCHV